MTSVCGLILEVRPAGVRATCTPIRCSSAHRTLSCFFFAGAPVDVGMSIDIASIDMVSEVNMVSFRPRLLTSCYAARHRLLPCDTEFHSAASRWRLRDPESVRLASSLGAGKLEKRFTPFAPSSSSAPLSAPRRDPQFVRANPYALSTSPRCHSRWRLSINKTDRERRRREAV